MIPIRAVMTSSTCSLSPEYPSPASLLFTSPVSWKYWPSLTQSTPSMAPVTVVSTTRSDHWATLYQVNTSRVPLSWAPETAIRERVQEIPEGTTSSAAGMSRASSQIVTSAVKGCSTALRVASWVNLTENWRPPALKGSLVMGWSSWARLG